jgi:hypothetical protein
MKLSNVLFVALIYFFSSCGADPFNSKSTDTAFSPAAATANSCGKDPGCAYLCSDFEVQCLKLYPDRKSQCSQMQQQCLIMDKQAVISGLRPSTPQPDVHDDEDRRSGTGGGGGAPSP